MSIEARMVLFGVRVYHAVVNFFNNLCSSRSKEDTYESFWESIDLDAGESWTAPTREELPSLDVMLHHVTRNRNDRRIAVHWTTIPREPYSIDELFVRPEPAWFFIGYMTGEETIDCTDDLMSIVCNNNVVSPKLLSYLIPSSTDKHWVYMPKSLNVVDFPSENILIGGEHDKKND